MWVESFFSISNPSVDYRFALIGFLQRESLRANFFKTEGK